MRGKLRAGAADSCKAGNTSSITTTYNPIITPRVLCASCTDADSNLHHRFVQKGAASHDARGAVNLKQSTGVDDPFKSQVITHQTVVS